MQPLDAEMEDAAVGRDVVPAHGMCARITIDQETMNRMARNEWPCLPRAPGKWATSGE